uniref:Uncharacterized protein n=1 Tax=Rhizophora mucronata TaxID=61149 RepID=A0A2P2NJA3_RHIMU
MRMRFNTVHHMKICFNDSNKLSTFFFQMNMQPQSDTLTAYSPKKLTPFMVS